MDNIDIAQELSVIGDCLERIKKITAETQAIVDAANNVKKYNIEANVAAIKEAADKLNGFTKPAEVDSINNEINTMDVVPNVASINENAAVANEVVDSVDIPTVVDGISNMNVQPDVSAVNAAGENAVNIMEEGTAALASVENGYQPVRTL